MAGDFSTTEPSEETEGGLEIPWSKFESSAQSSSWESSFLECIRHVADRHGYFYLSFEGQELGKYKALFEDAIDWSRLFFALPYEEKMQIRISSVKHYRGYGEFGQEKTLGKADQKETLDLGYEEEPVTREQLLGAPYFILRGPNQWPRHSASFDAAGFRMFFQNYLEELRQIGEWVLEAVVAAFGGKLSQDYRTHVYGMLRLLHYPQLSSKGQSGPEAGGFGVGPHTDAGFLVLLLQDQVGGLQAYCDEKKTWQEVKPRKGTLVVQFGEMLKHLVGGKATLHRVVHRAGTSRYSLPFFFEPPLEARISGSGPGVLGGGAPGVLYGEQMLRVFQRSFPGV